MKKLTEEENRLYKLVNHQDDDIANAAMKKLWAIDNTWHFCAEFDDLAVSKNTHEWEFCTCHD